MVSNNLIKLNDIINQYTNFEHLIYKIYYHGAATLSGIKPASLICFKNTNKINLKDIWDEYQKEIQNLIHLDYYELRRADECVAVLFYDKKYLTNIIENREVQSFLGNQGYGNSNTIDEYLMNLKQNFKYNCPDEIGVFLGYPLSDVVAFTSGNKDNSLLVGYWRVYSCINEAKKKFDAYDRARLEVCNVLSQGISPFELNSALYAS